MLLTIDIGNTNITFGVFKGDKLVRKFNIPTGGYSFNKLRKAKVRADDIIVCSVVPKVAKMLVADLKQLSGVKPYIIGKDVKVPIKNLYRKPAEVGQDRLVNAYAAGVLYGAPLIAIDFGTAITFDVISKRKEYMGGLIIPGLRISLEALREHTALLPGIKLGKPKELIGRDTRNSMLGGIVFGFAALCDDLSERIKNRIGRDALVIGTGGNIGLISDYCSCFDRIDRDLTLKGLSIIHKEGR